MVSVIMPVHNGSKYIAAAIDSILGQTFLDFELIIVDDGSTDDTWKIIEEYADKDNRIIPARNQKNLGICVTLNKAIDMVKGDLIARMDADDWSYPERLEKQVAYFNSNPDTVAVGGSIELCDEKMRVINSRHYELTDRNIRGKILRYSPFAHPAVMYKTEAVKKAGKYDPKLIDVEDYDLYFRLGKLGKFGNLKDTLLKLRTHGSSVSQKKINRQAWVTFMIKLKAIFVYGYLPSVFDILYLIAHLAGNILIPAGLKFRIFNLYRTMAK